MMRPIRSLSAGLIMSLFLLACTPPPKAIVVERHTISSRVETEKIGGAFIRIIEPGDTLYSIAFVNGLDVNKLAQWNGITDTSKLRVGQQLRLTKPLNFKAKPQVKAKRKAKPKITQHQTKPTAKLDSKSQSAPASASTVATAWRWPVTGTIIERYSIAQGQQGIAIKASKGKAVTSAKNGEVVYVGNGLKGYGNLVIIKHSEHFLSAYAHNQQTYVKEGQHVRAGQTIGSIGEDKKRRFALHFQIRKDGKPVNPLSYLPSR